MRLAAVAACLGAVAATTPLCLDGAWLEVPRGAVERGESTPHVMCGRTPACVVHTHLSRKLCASRPRPDDWPGGAGGSSSAVVRLLEALRERTLVFVGDSITEGVWDWLVCDSHREGLRSVRLDDAERGTGRGRIDAHVQSLRDPVMRARASAFWEAWFGASWGKEGLPLPMDTRVLAFPAARALLVFSKTHRFIERHMAALLTVGDVFVVNYGLHYDMASASTYSSDMSRLAELSASRLVLFRETSAQHFRGTGAYTTWSQAHTHGEKCACEAATAATEAGNTVQQLNEIARRQLSAVVTFLPFYNYTVQHHALHEEDYCAYESALKRSQGCCDCSHYCYTPHMSEYATLAIVDALAA